ncbi:DUF2304 domain-containing protein [Paenibacillus nasutitermitis]|uniref:DUF2304 domain-containing protein n=1 Tax=Paenibacillus nasutitermitis TaxID=1652958 RepID=A0A916ZC84_9BACL|nr:DUF2304 domain-containing protein [Paenibacillus nasutitermitis]GGD87515.1 hypothetical protein GCM10010911_52440 [Paenibacillus nasutitermitis]
MITLKLQILLFSGSIVCFFVLVNLIRKYRLELKYSMLWLFIMLVVLILSVFPNAFVLISNVMGIEMPVNALFLLVSFILILIMFSLTATVSRSTIKIKEMSQEIGLLKYQIEQLESKNNDFVR